MPAGRSTLDRFVAAQEAVLAQVRAELTHGEKRSHWMWFVFPQIAGLGTSTTAQHYALDGLDEARLYLDHPILGPRLVECTRIMLGWAGRRSAAAILGTVDALKFCSSMTLFELAAEGADAAEFSHALDAFYQGKRDDRTRRLVTRAAGEPPNRALGNF